MWTGIGAPCPFLLSFLIVVAIGALIGAFNGFFVAKFKLHPFIVTLATQLILSTILLFYVQAGNNNVWPFPALTDEYQLVVRQSPPF